MRVGGVPRRGSYRHAFKARGTCQLLARDSVIYLECRCYFNSDDSRLCRVYNVIYSVFQYAAAQSRSTLGVSHLTKPHPLPSTSALTSSYRATCLSAKAQIEL
jgi:hypothetical protein